MMLGQKGVISMTLKKLAGWMVLATFISNVYLGAANIALAKPVKEAIAQEQLEVININQASVDDLQKIRGIGPALAERIITYRNANSGFKSSEELKQVRGIGDMKFEKIKNQITM